MWHSLETRIPKSHFQFMTHFKKKKVQQRWFWKEERRNVEGNLTWPFARWRPLIFKILLARIRRGRRWTRRWHQPVGSSHCTPGSSGPPRGCNRCCHQSHSCPTCCRLGKEEEGCSRTAWKFFFGKNRSFSSALQKNIYFLSQRWCFIGHPFELVAIRSTTKRVFFISGFRSNLIAGHSNIWKKWNTLEWIVMGREQKISKVLSRDFSGQDPALDRYYGSESWLTWPGPCFWPSPRMKTSLF